MWRSCPAIIVTAQKVEQRAQDVPTTNSALSGSRFTKILVTDPGTLSSDSPGLNSQEQSAGKPGVVIRGVGFH